MTDAALFWDADTASADIAIVDGDLSSEAGLRTAVLISLFTDRRARPDDVLPQADADPRGWWADSYTGDDRIGSRLWLLAREKRLPVVLTKARDYAVEALDWMLQDGIASAVEVTTETTPQGWLGIGVFITRPGGPDRQRFDFVWKGVQP